MLPEPSPDREDDERIPSDEPLHEASDAPVRRPIVAFFSRRAFLSRDTGRWHKLTGGRDHQTDEPAGEPDDAEEH